MPVSPATSAMRSTLNPLKRQASPPTHRGSNHGSTHRNSSSPGQGQDITDLQQSPQKAPQHQPGSATRPSGKRQRREDPKLPASPASGTVNSSQKTPSHVSPPASGAAATSLSKEQLEMDLNTLKNNEEELREKAAASSGGTEEMNKLIAEHKNALQEMEKVEQQLKQLQQPQPNVPAHQAQQPQGMQPNSRPQNVARQQPSQPSKGSMPTPLSKPKGKDPASLKSVVPTMPATTPRSNASSFITQQQPAGRSSVPVNQAPPQGPFTQQSYRLPFQQALFYHDSGHGIKTMTNPVLQNPGMIRPQAPRQSNFATIGNNYPSVMVASNQRPVLQQQQTTQPPMLSAQQAQQQLMRQQQRTHQPGTMVDMRSQAQPTSYLGLVPNTVLGSNISPPQSIHTISRTNTGGSSGTLTEPSLADQIIKLNSEIDRIKTNLPGPENENLFVNNPPSPGRQNSTALLKKQLEILRRERDHLNTQLDVSQR